MEQKIGKLQLVLLCLLTFMEGVDLSVYGASMRAWEADLGMTMEALSSMEILVGVCAAVSGPAWAALLDAGIVARTTMIVRGSFVWGLCTAAIGATISIPVIFALRAIIACTLSLVMPITQAVIAEVSSTKTRGRYFILLTLPTHVGLVLGEAACTAISNVNVLGVRGWRVAFLSAGGLSIATSCAVKRFVKLPESQPRVGTFAQLLHVQFTRMRNLFKIRTFLMIVSQGVCGMTAGKAQAFNVMWFQYSGLSDGQAGVVASLRSIGQMLGGALIAWAADVLTSWRRFLGRPLVGSFMIGTSIPLLWFLFAPSAIFNVDPSFLYIALLVFAVSCCLNTGSGVDRAVLADIAPRQSVSSIMALDWALHTAVGAIIGPSIVALGAKGMGYRSTTLQVSQMSPVQRRQNASALGSAILAISSVCYFGTATFYACVARSYRLDVERAEREQDVCVGTHEEEVQVLGNPCGED